VQYVFSVRRPKSTDNSDDGKKHFLSSQMSVSGFLLSPKGDSYVATGFIPWKTVGQNCRAPAGGDRGLALGSICGNSVALCEG